MEELQEKIADFKDKCINHYYYTCSLDSNTNVLYSLIINRNNFLSKLVAILTNALPLPAVSKLGIVYNILILMTF